MFLPIKIHQRLEWPGTDRPDLSGVGGAVLIVLIDVTGRTNRNVYTTPASPLTPATSSSSSKCGAWREGGREGEATSSCQDPWDENNFEM